MARPGSAAWFREQQQVLETGGEAAASVRRASFIAAGGDARGVPREVFAAPFIGNPQAINLKGGDAPRKIFPGLEEAEIYINRNANLANSGAWFVQQDPNNPDVQYMYIAEETK